MTDLYDYDPVRKTLDSAGHLAGQSLRRPVEGGISIGNARLPERGAGGPFREWMDRAQEEGYS